MTISSRRRGRRISPAAFLHNVPHFPDKIVLVAKYLVAPGFAQDLPEPNPEPKPQINNLFLQHQPVSLVFPQCFSPFPEVFQENRTEFSGFIPGQVQPALDVFIHFVPDMPVILHRLFLLRG